MRDTLHQIECNEDELGKVPDALDPVRLEHDEYPTPLRKAHTLDDLERA